MAHVLSVPALQMRDPVTMLVEMEADNRSLVVFGSGDEVTVQAGEEGIRFLLVSGRPIKEPVAWYGPIVMNTHAEIQQAIAELNSGAFIKEGSGNVLRGR